jgi:hypothetical protein
MLNPSDRAQLTALQALCLAYLGRAQEAVLEGREALNAAQAAPAPVWQRSYIQFLLARIYLLSGQPDKALDQLEPLLRTSGSRMSPGWLRIDPTFARLHGNPRFDRLVNGS